LEVDVMYMGAEPLPDDVEEFELPDFVQPFMTDTPLSLHRHFDMICDHMESDV